MLLSEQFWHIACTSELIGFVLFLLTIFVCAIYSLRFFQLCLSPRCSRSCVVFTQKRFVTETSWPILTSSSSWHRVNGLDHSSNMAFLRPDRRPLIPISKQNLFMPALQVRRNKEFRRHSSSHSLLSPHDWAHCMSNGKIWNFTDDFQKHRLRAFPEHIIL